MKLIKKISKNTFTETIVNKYSPTVRRVSNYLLIPLILFCFIMMLICNLKGQDSLVFVFFGCWLIFISLLIIIQNKERMRIIKNDPELQSIIIRKIKWYSYDKYDMAKFNAIMEKRTTESLRNKNGLVSKRLIKLLITNLKEENEQHIKIYITFGIIFAFLINPFFTSYSGKFLDYIFTTTFSLALITIAIALTGIIYLALILSKFQNIYLGFIKGYHTGTILIEQLYNIKADILLNSGKSVQS